MLHFGRSSRFLCSASAKSTHLRISVSLDDTVRTPKTSFPMRANALVTEPLLQKHMCDSLYKWQDKYRRDHIPWVLHDGPPYANGELHVGHALNKVLKDIVNRYKLLRGFRVHYVPGWDTHGLPIELKALEALMKKNKKKSQSEVTGKKELEGIEIRELCKAYVEKFINLQKIDFQRWGIMADWENYYATYHKEYEYNQIRVFKKLFEKGMIFRALKPVHWSPSSNTALAEAELEYKDDHESLAVFVGYKLDSNSSARLSELANLKDFGGSVQAVIWTTTPWSLPASLAIAYGPTMKYALVKTEAFVENARDSNIFLVAKSEISSLVGDHSYEVLHEFDGSMLSDLTAIHPFIDRRIAFLESEFVVEGSGTGLVHSAPAHGREDFIVSKRNNIAIINPVNVDATYNHLAGEDLAGKSIFGTGMQTVIEKLVENGALLRQEKYIHKYPYDWRTKKPVIQLATEQWFINLEQLKDQALQNIDDVEITPSSGRSRLKATVESRSEWCISRQRHWGVPIPAFRNSKTKELLMNYETLEHFENMVKEHGVDCWWAYDAEQLLPPKYRFENSGIIFEKTFDTLDVWFDSGTSWAGVLNSRNVDVPCDLVIEGSDQHRGWFQSLLLTSTAINEKAPYKKILSHGFVVDEKMQKMSKSLGNIVSPKDIIQGSKGKFEANGSDILRFWVASANTTNEVSVGPQVIARNALSVRKIRNTFRYLLGSLSDFEPVHSRSLFDPINYETNFKPLEKFILAYFASYMDMAESSFENFEIYRIVKSTEVLVTSVLSQMYFEAIKASLYSDDPQGHDRYMMQAVLFEAFQCLLKSVGPILPHTTQDVYNHIQHIPLKKAIHQEVSELSDIQKETFFNSPWPNSEYRSIWKNDKLLKEWDHVLVFREKLNSILENARVEEKFFQGNFSEVCVNLIPKKSESDELETLLSHLESLSQFNQLHSFLCVSEASLNSNIPSDELPVLIRDLEVESGIAFNVQIYHPQGQTKCNRCRRYAKYCSEIDTSQGIKSLCLNCINVLEKSGFVE